MNLTRLAAISALGLALVACQGPPQGGISASQDPTPEGDEIGMARELGPATWARCAAFLADPDAKVYELSYLRSNTMPLSPFAGPYEQIYLPSNGLPGTNQMFNVDVLNENANPGQHGTQIDAFGHFAYLEEPWDGTSDFVPNGTYYGGLTQAEVKPSPDSPLLKLSIDKIPPIITSAVVLDVRKHAHGGEAMSAGQVITPEHLEQVLEAQGLKERGILPGDVVYIYTGWSDHYKDPDVDKIYYSMAPGLSYDAAKYLGDRRVVGVGLDTWGLDAVAEGQLTGEAPPPEGTPPGMAFPVHYHFLTQAGVHTLENIKLNELAADGVQTACTMILPARLKGGAGSPIRPVAIGVPGE